MPLVGVAIAHHCKLIIIDDNPERVRMTVKHFPPNKYRIYAAESCVIGFKLFNLHNPDCVLLDCNLPDAESYCLKIRSREKLVRTAIVITGGDSVRELHAYTICQVDGFVLLEESFNKVYAVVEMIMRRLNWERGIIKVGDITLKQDKFRMFRYSHLVARLSANQFQLLYLLIQESPNFVSEDDIAQRLYNSDFAPQYADSIRGLIQRLRKKLGP